MAEANRVTERFKAGEVGGLVPAMVEASDADATTGEIMGVLKQHLGWRSPH
jgi:methylmalonyl-CoA mutase N-terminal domain/subunit